MLRDEMRIETLGNFAKYVLERDAAGERGAARRREKRGVGKQEGMIDANYAKARERRETKE